jgi:hypothetical protein
MTNTFFKGKLNLLVIVSDGGFGKTTTVEKALRDSDTKNHVIKGHVTPLQFYIESYENKDELIVIDDVDGLLGNKNIIPLMKQLCDTVPVKTMQYHTTRDLPVPCVFRTRSKVIILLNRLPLENENVMAFLTRGIVVNFIPNPQEIFNELKKFARDKKILSFIEKNIRTLSSINFRVYKHAVSLKQSGLDWERFLLEAFQLRDEMEIAAQVTDSRKPYSERVRLWKHMTGKSQSSYDRLVIDLGERMYRSDGL